MKNEILAKLFLKKSKNKNQTTALFTVDDKFLTLKVLPLPVKNADTFTAVFDYGPFDDKTKGFQVLFKSRQTNSGVADGEEVKEIYYSNGGTLNLDTNKITPLGGLTEKYASMMGLKPNLLPETSLNDIRVATSADTGGDPVTMAHIRNWMECVRSRREPNAPVEAGYNHSIAVIMANAAYRTGQKVIFDRERQEVIAGDKVFKY